jgi:hypothetical protein
MALSLGAFSRAFNDEKHFSSLRESEQELYDKNKNYEMLRENLTKEEQKALTVAYTKLGTAQGLEEWYGTAGANNIKGIGIFNIEGEYKFSEATNNVYDSGTMDNSPTTGWCYVSCTQSIGQINNNLSALVFRHPNGFKSLTLYSNKMLSYANQANVPVILYDAYFHRSYAWYPTQMKVNQYEH